MLSVFRKALKERRPRLILEQLEERIVLDASVAPGVIDNNIDTHHDAQQSTDPHPTADSSTTGQTGQGQPVDAQHAACPVDASVNPTSPVAGTASGPLTQSFEHGLDVILVASDVQNPQAIKDAARPGADVILYDGTQDSLSTIEASLAKLVENTGEKIEHLAIVSHGDPGIINISQKDGWGVGNVEQNPTPWAELGKLLTKGAQIDFYGCDIGQGQEGAQLVASIAHLTGATVWASNNPTGSVQGADWNLEVHSGQSELSVLLDVTKLTNSGIDLDNTVITNGSFELKDASGNWYTGWTLINTPLVPTGSYFPWLSAWGIVTDWNATTNPMKLGKFNSPTDATDVKYPYHDYANNYDLVPLLAPGLTSQDFTAKDGHNVAFAAQNYNADMKMYQDFTLPAGTKTLSWDMSYMTYWRSPYFADDGAGGDKDQYLSVSLYDVADPAHPVFLENLVKTAPAGDHSDPADPFHARQNLTDPSSNMTHFSFNVTAYSGKTVRLEVDVIAERTLLTAGFDNFSVDVNHKPVAYDQTVQAFEDVPLVVALGGNDSDPGAGQTLTYFLASTPAKGTLYDYSDTGLTTPLTGGVQLTSNKVWYQTALHDYSDTSFNFYVKDDGGGNNDTSANATLSLHGNVVNGTPVADPKYVSGSGSFTITLTGHDTGQPDPTKVSFNVTDYDLSTPGIQTENGGTLVASGVVIKDAWGNYSQDWTYTPKTAGSDNFTYTFVTPDGPWQGFSAGTTVDSSTAGHGIDLAVADLNQDGRSDIIVCNGDWNNGYPLYASYFYLANTSGGFNSGVQIGNDTITKVAIDVGDLNGDGHPDLVTRNNNGAMVYFWNSANNNFDNGITLPGSNDGQFGSIGIGDVNGDGHPDIVMARNFGDDIVIYKNAYKNGSWGNFFDSPGTVINTTSAYGTTSTVCVADVNGDGQPDIVIGKTATYNIVLLNDGYGNFSTSNVQLLAGGRWVQYMAVGDVDGNGTRDLVAANDNGQPETFYRNDGFGNFTVFDIGAADNTNSANIRLADVNHDGALDAIVSNYNGTPSKYYLFNKSTGTFGAGVNFGTGAYTIGGAVGDLNGDGFTDYVASSDSGGVNQVFYNLGFANQTSNTATVNITVTSAAAMAMPGAVDSAAPAPMSFVTMTSDPLMTSTFVAPDAGLGVISGTGTVTADPLAAEDPFLKM